MAHVHQLFVEGLYAGPDIDDQHRKDGHGDGEVRREFVDAEQHHRDQRPHEPWDRQAEHDERLKKSFAHDHGAHVDPDTDAEKHGDHRTDKNPSQALNHVKEKRAVGNQSNRFIHGAGGARQQTRIDQVEQPPNCADARHRKEWRDHTADQFSAEGIAERRQCAGARHPGGLSVSPPPDRLNRNPFTAFVQ